jgi:hypothetical protein
MIHDGKNKNGLKNITTKKFNEQIIMDFWMTRFESYFKSPNLCHFLLDLYFFSPNMYNKIFFKWASFHMDFIDWLITTQGPLNIGFKCFFHSSVNFSI